LAILLKMKSTLGFETMLKYSEKYVLVTGRYNPGANDAVKNTMQALCLDGNIPVTRA